MLKYLIPALLLALPAFAQEQAIDPRLAGPAVKAMQAEIQLREAMIQALREDSQKREADLAAWFKAWFAEPK